MGNETTDLGATGGIWDRVWRGKSSSHKRGLLNVAGETSRVATLIAEGARLIDEIDGPDRTLEMHSICREILALTESQKATAEHLLQEVGPLPETRRLSFWRSLRRSFMRWLRG